MSSQFDEFIDQPISLITNDGKHIIGTLRGVDQSTNVIVEGAFERVYKGDEPVEDVPFGLFLARGDNVAILGELDPALDAELSKTVRAEPLKPIVH
eukprot:CAMPEP_0114611890 /NCGR_PEP_ID=MMETSP0168-20121206/4346_1 /TAXON_ID=95228 ORGANISM="Vannella sp., Strain DIVA3 517/6/12" /NCGR_SAMPLE_ID=MMETSP0168 /ASSEMBLY_ACC=CAM_ASM_000044 /LENGTH=95 /DNA_ID=CAMNT_0001822871 /DNA_START=183 /DNA_END=470 /DNA_ORIENTATION=-